jgi:hypothetical protein
MRVRMRSVCVEGEWGGRLPKLLLQGRHCFRAPGRLPSVCSIGVRACLHALAHPHALARPARALRVPDLHQDSERADTVEWALPS